MLPHGFRIKFTRNSWFWVVVSMATLGVSFSVYRGFQPNPETNREKIFDYIYNNKLWGVNSKGVGHSGVSSTMESTKIYRSFLQDFLAAKKIRSVVDVGCGDWEFSQSID